MRKLLLTVMLMATTAAVAGGVAYATAGTSRTTELGPFLGGGIQLTGSCGNVWGSLGAVTIYSVYPPNRDGTVTAVQTVEGVLTTVAGKSPNACSGGPDNGSTIGAGVHVRLHAIEMETITGGTFNPSAHCAAQCFTAAFVPAFFGPGATVADNSEFEQWTTLCNGGYVFSGNSGRTAGDITGQRQSHCG